MKPDFELLESVLVLALFLRSLNMHLPQQISQTETLYSLESKHRFGKSAEEDADSNFVKKVPKQEQTLVNMVSLFLSKSESILHSYLDQKLYPR